MQRLSAFADHVENTTTRRVRQEQSVIFRYARELKRSVRSAKFNFTAYLRATMTSRLQGLA